MDVRLRSIGMTLLFSGVTLACGSSNQARDDGDSAAEGGSGDQPSTTPTGSGGYGANGDGVEDAESGAAGAHDGDTPTAGGSGGLGGGMNAGGASAAGSSGSGAGNPTTGDNGAACNENTDCRSGVCVPELNDDTTPSGWTGGYCIQACAVGGACSAGGECYPLGEGVSACLADCSDGSDCRNGYGCQLVDAGLRQACVPRCDNPGAACALGSCMADGSCQFTFDQIDVGAFAGSHFACGLVTDGTIACWGDNDLGQRDAPAGSFIDLALGKDFGCAVGSDGGLTCWGNDDDGLTEPPAGSFVAVSAGYSHACALATDGTIACWGSSHATEAPSGSFEKLEAGGISNTCAIDVSGRVACWPDGVGVPQGEFVDITVGHDRACALSIDGSAACWDGSTTLDVPSGEFGEISAGEGYACGARSQGSLECWGTGELGSSAPPTGSFTHPTAQQAFACALDDERSIVCWGSRSHSGTPPDGSFRDLALGYNNGCALHPDGTVACWGSVCAPGTVGCADANHLGACDGDGVWVAWEECADQACVDGSCVGVCSPGVATCDGFTVTACGDSGTWYEEDCEYGCVEGKGCETGFRKCTNECAVLSCDVFGSCTCEGGTVLVCTDRACDAHVDCGTLGYCDESVCRARESCDDAPCLNGATCVQNEFTYTCQCAQGFWGKNCDLTAADCAEIDGFLCDDGDCFLSDRLCDGTPDCGNGEDEVDCSALPPAEWVCSTSYYDALDGCDCDCGAWDPDCDVQLDEIYGCAVEETCVPPGLCSAG